jgi:hypothetical protein
MRSVGRVGGIGEMGNIYKTALRKHNKREHLGYFGVHFKIRVILKWILN